MHKDFTVCMSMFFWILVISFCGYTKISLGINFENWNINHWGIVSRLKSCYLYYWISTCSRIFQNVPNLALDIFIVNSYNGKFFLNWTFAKIERIRKLFVFGCFHSESDLSLVRVNCRNPFCLYPNFYFKKLQVIRNLYYWISNVKNTFRFGIRYTENPGC